MHMHMQYFTEHIYMYVCMCVCIIYTPNIGINHIFLSIFLKEPMSVLLPIAAPGLEFELGIAKSWAAKSLHRSKPLQDVVVEGGGLRDVLRAPVVPWFQTLYGHMGY